MIKKYLATPSSIASWSNLNLGTGKILLKYFEMGALWGSQECL